ncbi:MAG: hypothetical protein ABI599_09965 [Flavobacteriales bacterium]
MLLLLLVILFSTCIPSKDGYGSLKTEQELNYSRSVLKAELGLEAPEDVYAFIKCLGRVSVLEEILPHRAVCEVTLDYRNSDLVTCTTHVYDFDGSDSLVNIGVNSTLEAMFIKKGGAFSFVDVGTGSYSFWIDAEKPLDAIACP